MTWDYYDIKKEEEEYFTSTNRIRDFGVIRTKVYNSIVDISKEFDLDKQETLSVVKRVLAHMEGRDSL
jgi:hypothetical protein